MKYHYCFAVALLPLALAAEVTTEYSVIKKCSRKTQRGDKINVHYKGTLQDGTKFDSSYDRSAPLGFTVGEGQVIQGWDEGLLEMCPGDKRVLTIPPEFGYGSRAKGPIPAGSTLIFETELMSIDGVAPEPDTETEVAEPSTEPSTAELEKETKTAEQESKEDL